MQIQNLHILINIILIIIIIIILSPRLTQTLNEIFLISSFQEQTFNPSFRFDFLNFSKEIVKDTKEDHQFYNVGVETAEIKKLPKGSCKWFRLSPFWGLYFTSSVPITHKTCNGSMWLYSIQNASKEILQNKYICVHSQ